MKSFQRTISSPMRKAIALVVLVGAISALAAMQRPKTADIENSLIKVTFDINSKTWSLYQNAGGDWTTILHNVSVGLDIIQRDSVALIPEGTDVTTKVEKFKDALGAGKQLIVRVKGTRAEWSLNFGMYDGKSHLALQASIVNRSGNTWKTNKLRLLDARDAGFLQFVTDTVVMHRNGYQSWSQSEVVRLGASKSQTSYWSTLFYEPQAYRSILFGFMTNVVSTNRFIAEPMKSNDGQLRMRAECDIATAEVGAGKEFTSDRLLISIDSSPHDNLVHYGEYLEKLAPRVNKPFTPTGRENVAVMDRREVPAGWCSWYYYYERIGEDSIVQNMNFAARHLRSAGLKYIQIDDGYQIAAGDWDTNRKFPQGHRWLVEQIHEKKLLAGLWVAPFAIAENSTVFKEHPDWLLREKNDSLKVFFTNTTWGGKVYSLDPTIHEVQVWLENLFYTIESYWGYDYVKIDFLHFASDGVKYRVPMTSAQAYQLGLAAIRRGVGSDKFILGCGAPIGSSIGYVDGMRIGQDIYAGWQGVLPGINAAASRYFLHGSVWYDDPDCLVVREPLSLDQARVWASVVALSGQMNLLSDKLTALPAERVELLRKTMPVFGKAARPVDMFAVPPEGGVEITSSADGRSIRLPEVWKFATGDKSDWKSSDFDDSEWKEIPIPSHWENFGAPGHDGYVWYRVKFTLPEDWQNAPLSIALGKIDDCDETFLNGERIGATGTMPPAYNTEWTTFRTYKIPQEAVRWNGENTLAVRVYDGGGPGGLYSVADQRPAAIWNLPVDKAFDKWNVVGLFNWSDEKAKVSCTPAQLNLQPRKSYLVYESWSNTYLGELRNQLAVNLRPTSCAVVTVHEKKNTPILLSTTRHIVQGAVDIADEKWDAAKKTLTVVCDNVLDGEYGAVLYAPEELGTPRIVASCKSEVEQIAGDVFRVKLFPYGSTKLTWKALF